MTSISGMDIYRRTASSASALAAAVIDLLVIFDAVEWSNEQVGAVNLVALLVVGVIVGPQVRTPA